MTHRTRKFGAAARAFLAAVALLLCGLALTSCQNTTNSATQESSGEGTFTVGVRSDIIGFSQLNEANGRYYGMEVDLAEEMAKRLGYAAVAFKTVTPDTRKEMLQNGEVDALVACYSTSESREKNFDFSPAYYNDSIRLMVEKSSLITNLDGLKDGTIGTMAGANTAPILLQEFVSSGFSTGEIKKANEDNSDVTFDGWHLKEYESYEDLSNALEKGEVDAAAMDGAICKSFMSNKRSLVEGISLDPQQYAVATQKNSELSARVSSVIQDMLDDGTIEALIEKWN